MSLMSREDMLRELELLPVWQLRQPLPLNSSTQVPVSDIDASAVIATGIAEPEQPAPVVAAVELAAAESTAPAPTEVVAPAPEVNLPPQADSTQLLETAAFETASFTAVEQAQPLRLLLSEDGVYAFLLEPYAEHVDTQAVETLLKNMMRAMQLHARVDVTNTAAELFAAHAPKIIISMGAEPANQLFGKLHAVSDWRSIQQESPLLYENIPLIVTYHPAFLLQNPTDKASAWHDLCTAMRLMQRL